MSKKHKARAIVINGQAYPVVDEFDVLRHRWEMDGFGYVVLDGDTRRIVLTNHEKPYFASHNEVADLIEKTENVLNGLRIAVVSVK